MSFKFTLGLGSTGARSGARSASVAALALSLAVTVNASSGDGSPTRKREITVEDSVSMAMVAAPADPMEGVPHPYFSPDGKYFVVLVRSANVKNDTNDASLLLYKTEDAFHEPKPDTLVTMSSSSSDRYAIHELRWLDDNHTLVFLGESPRESAQIYEFDIATRRLRKRTHHPTSITNYDITGDGGSLAFVAEPPETWPTPKGQEDRREVVIDGQELGNLLAGHHFQPASPEVYWQETNAAAQRIPVEAGYYVPEIRISWCPTGR